MKLPKRPRGATVCLAGGAACAFAHRAFRSLSGCLDGRKERMTETPAGQAGDWAKVSTGWTFQGVGALALASLVVILRILSLQWLWMRWKDKPEAGRELRRLVSEHSGQTYAEWTHLVGYKKRCEFITDAGTWYQADIEAVWDDEPGGAVRVLFSLDDGGPSAFFPMTESLLIEP